MKFTKQRQVDASIPTASMADIAFLLIIFFMVTTVHEVDRTSVNTPESFFTVEAEKGAAVVVATAQDDGTVLYKFSDGEQMSQPVSGPNDIYLETSRLMFPFAANPQLGPQFMIKADGSMPFEKIDQLLEQLRRGGAQKVLLLTTGKKRQE